MNENWTRWITASVNKHISDSTGVTCFIEGTRKNTRDLSEYLEIRIDGPDVVSYSANESSLRVTINVLMTTMIANDNLDDSYAMDRLIGKVLVALGKVIVAYKYGNGVDDDGTLLGCMGRVPLNISGEMVLVERFGQVDPGSNVTKAAAECEYEVTLS